MNANTGSSLWSYKIKVAKKKKTRRGGTSIVDRVKDPFIWGDSGGTDKEAVGGGVAVADGRVFVTSGFGLALALDAQSGAEIWRTATRTPLHSAPAVDNGRMFSVSDDNELFAFDTDTVAPFSSGEIVALRVQNGGVLWQDSLDSSGNLTPLAALNDIGAGPVVADGYVFASAQSGSLGAFDLRTGQRVWSQPAGSLGFPLVAGDFIYTVTTEGEVACLSKTDGTVIWITQLPAFKNEKKRKKRIAWTGPLADDVYVPPIVANDTVYYVTDKAKLVALR